MKDLDYFMFYLCCFLRRYECKLSFKENDMYYRSCNSENSSGFGICYNLTNFAVVYYKLYYIAYIFCENKNIIGFCGRESKQIKESIDSRTVIFTR